MRIAIVTALTFVAHLATMWLYGFHRDELYLMTCGDHLAWGSFDHAPLTPALSHVAQTLFGSSPCAQRVIAALAGSAVVALTGLIAKRLGGNARAQLLAMGCVLVAPAFIYTRGVFATNAIDQLVWVAATYLVVAILDGSRKAWLVLGVVLGIGLLNKYTVLVLGLSLAIGLLTTRHLLTPWPYVAAAIAIVVWLPNLAWQFTHDTPSITFFTDYAERMHARAALFYQQPIIVNPLAFGVAMTGLVVAWRTRLRIFAVMFVAVFVTFAVLSGKPYYPIAMYPVLFAIGAIHVEPRVRRWHVGVFAASGVLAFVLTLPIVPRHPFNAELAQFADWRAVASQLAGAARANGAQAVLSDSYGTASAVAFYTDVPVIGGANDFYRRGAPVEPDVAIAVGYTPDVLGQFFGEITAVGTLDGNNRYDFPRTIYRCRGKRASIRANWAALRRFD